MSLYSIYYYKQYADGVADGATDVCACVTARPIVSGPEYCTGIDASALAVGTLRTKKAFFEERLVP